MSYLTHHMEQLCDLMGKCERAIISIIIKDTVLPRRARRKWHWHPNRPVIRLWNLCGYYSSASSLHFGGFREKSQMICHSSWPWSQAQQSVFCLSMDTSKEFYIIGTCSESSSINWSGYFWISLISGVLAKSSYAQLHSCTVPNSRCLSKEYQCQSLQLFLVSYYFVFCFHFFSRFECLLLEMFHKWKSLMAFPVSNPTH